MTKIRAFALVGEYPTLSQTYKENEFRALLPYCELRIASFRASHAPHREHLPFTPVETYTALKNEIDAFEPDVIHGHYIHTAEMLARAADHAKRPFTLRTHSFDVIGETVEKLRVPAQFANRDNCLGVLCFPFLKDKLIAAGIGESKIVECWPVVDFDRFHDPSPNGEAVMNTGACLPKKNMESFVELALKVPQRRFNLYPIGYLARSLGDYNRACGSPVHVEETVEPHDMPRVYKRHQWLVYSANRDVPTIGWPMSIAEAQAAGVGVAVQRVRSDIETYVGEGGFVFDTLDEAARIVASPCPAHVREAGFRQARKSDVRGHIQRLLEMWKAGGVGSDKARNSGASSARDGPPDDGKTSQSGIRPDPLPAGA